MPSNRPKPISALELAKRLRRITKIARGMGFIGRIEYCHVFSQAGGAQYGLAREPENDLPIVYAEAFERDADPVEFSLEAMIAHERGHQLIARHPRLKRIVPMLWNDASEEILASLLGSLLVDSIEGEKNLLLKAMVESIKLGNDLESVQDHFVDIRNMLRGLI